jgi:hypothetical protein
MGLDPNHLCCPIGQRARDGSGTTEWINHTTRRGGARSLDRKF